MAKWIVLDWELTIPKYRRIDLPFGLLRFRQIGKVVTVDVLGRRVIARCGGQVWIFGLFLDFDK